MDGLENMIYMIDQLLDTKSNYTHNRRRGGKRL